MHGGRRDWHKKSAVEERAAVFRSVTGRKEGRREIYCLLGADQSRGGERGWDTFTHRRSIMNEVSDLSLSSVVVQERETDFQKAISLGKEEEGD